MRRTFFTALLLAIALSAYPQWYWVNPSPTGQHLSDVCFVNDTVGFVTGHNGTILKTTNAGETWNSIPLNTFRQMKKVWFCDLNTGFIACDSGFVYKTANGGDDWMQIETGSTGIINDLLFIDDQTGFIAYDDGNLMKTTDGGSTWVSKISNNPFWSITSVAFANHTRGIATTSLGKYYITNDGGETWAANTEPSKVDLVDSYFLNENVCFVSGRFNFFMKSNDGGLTWESFNCHVPVENLIFKDENTGFGLSDEFFYGDGLIYKTINGGHTWTPTEIEFCNAFTFTDDNTLYAVGESGRLLKSQDNGATYFNYNHAVTYDDFLDIHFPCADTGYAVSFFGEIVKSTDAGKNWELLPQGPFQRLNGVWFTSADHGFITTDSSVYATANGGISWNKVLHAPGWMTKIQFINNRTGFVIGEGQGLFYRTDDGGASWQLLYQSELEWPRGMHFVNNNVGYLALDYTVIKTVDGGITWSLTSLSPEDPYCSFNEVFFVNQEIGYVAGGCYTAKTFKTVDGGNSWIEQSVSDNYFRGLTLYFIDENKGFLGCDGHGFFQTNDGGDTWTRLEYMTGYHDAITFSSDGSGYVAGSNGKIMKTINKGMVPVISPNKPTFYFTLYPNPVSEEIIITSENLTGAVSVSIYNSSGKCVYTSKFEGKAIQIRTSALTSGLYFVRINSANGTEVKKVVVL